MGKPKKQINKLYTPATPQTVGNKNVGSFPKRLNIIVLKVSSNMLQEVHTPNSIVGFFREIWTSGEIMLHHLVGRIGKEGLGNSIVGSFQTQDFGTMQVKP